MRAHRIRILTTGVVFALVLAACGGDGGTQAGGVLDPGDPSGPSDPDPADASAELLAVMSTEDMTDEEYAAYLAALEEASKEEGVLTYYFSAPAASAQRQFDPFFELYPWIELEYVTGGTLELMERLLTETASGRPSADILQGGPLEDRTLCRDEGLCLPYQPRGKRDLPEERRYDDCACVVADFFTFHILYNTDRLSPDEAPATYEELIEPEWRGRFGVNVDQLDWFAGMLAFLGDEDGIAYMEALAANDPVIYAGSAGLERLIAGEFEVALPQTATRQVRDLIADGAPIEVITTPTVIAQPDMYFPLAAAPHPATTRLYMEFIMTQEWQDALGEEIVKVPMNPDSPVPSAAVGILENELFFETTDNFGDYDERVSLHQSIFITGG